MTTTITRNITRYDSLSDIAERGRKGVGTSKQPERGSNWFGTADYEAAVELAAKGWHQGGEQIQAAIERIKPKVGPMIEVLSRISYIPTPNRPGLLDVGRYAAGHPYCMISPVLTSSTPIVKIGVPALWSGGCSTDMIMEAGAIVSAVAEVLTAAGYAVEVVALAGWCRRNGDHEITEVVLKRSVDKVDIEDLAFGIAHPSMSRRFIFASGELNAHAEEINCRTGGGYGGSGSRWSGTMPELVAGLSDIDLTVLACVGGYRFLESAIAAIEKWQGK